MFSQPSITETRATCGNEAVAGRGVIRGLLGAVAGLALSLVPAQALELVGGAINSTDPGTSFNGSSFSLALPWNNVGYLGSGVSAIYLGDIDNNGTFWVLTAYHGATFLPSVAYFEDQPYNTVAGSYSRLSNQAGSPFDPAGNPIDLVMFRLDLAVSPSGLSTLSLRSTGLPVGQDLYYVGYGGGTKRWGFNDNEGLVLLDDGYGLMPALESDYDNASANNNEARLIGGDSGGATFVYNNLSNSWQLAGVMLAGDTATSYSASIPNYRTQILATAPEPSATLLLTLGVAALGSRNRRRGPTRR